MTTEPGDEIADAADTGLLVFPVDRDLVIRTLRVALAQGRLTEDEHDARAAQASELQSRAALAALTADLPADLLTVRPTAGFVWTGVGLTVAAATVIVGLLLWQPDNAGAFLAFILAAITLLVAPFITVGLALDVRHQRRSGGQLPGPGGP